MKKLNVHNRKVTIEKSNGILFQHSLLQCLYFSKLYVIGDFCEWCQVSVYLCLYLKTTYHSEQKSEGSEHWQTLSHICKQSLQSLCFPKVPLWKPICKGNTHPSICYPLVFVLYEFTRIVLELCIPELNSATMSKSEKISTNHQKMKSSTLPFSSKRKTGNFKTNKPLH